MKSSLRPEVLNRFLCSFKDLTESLSVFSDIAEAGVEPLEGVSFSDFLAVGLLPSFTGFLPYMLFTA